MMKEKSVSTTTISSISQRLLNDVLVLDDKQYLSEIDIVNILKFWKRYHFYELPLVLTACGIRMGQKITYGALVMGRYHYIFHSIDIVAVRRFSTSYSLNYLEDLEVHGGLFTGMGELRTQLQQGLPKPIEHTLLEQIWNVGQISRGAETILIKHQLVLDESEELCFVEVPEEAKIIFADLLSVATGEKPLSHMKLKPTAQSCWPSLYAGNFLVLNGSLGQWVSVHVIIFQFQLFFFNSCNSLEPIGIVGIEQFQPKQLFLDDFGEEVHTDQMRSKLLQKQQSLLQADKYLKDDNFYCDDALEQFVMRAEINHESLLNNVLKCDNIRQVIGFEMHQVIEDGLNDMITQQYPEISRSSLDFQEHQINNIRNSITHTEDYLDFDFNNDFEHPVQSILYLSADQVSALRQLKQILSLASKAYLLTKVNVLRRVAASRQLKGNLLMEFECKICYNGAKLLKGSAQIYQQLVDSIQIGFILMVKIGRMIVSIPAEQVDQIQVETDSKSTYLSVTTKKDCYKLLLNEQTSVVHNILSQWSWK